MKLQHCLGGLEGLGPVSFDKRVFAEPWEKRMFGINLALLGLSEHLSEATPQYPIENIPTTFKRKYTAADLRKRVEAMHPFDYFRYRYYEKWLASAAEFLIAEGNISEQELEARTTACLNHEDLLTQVRRNLPIDTQAIDFLRDADSPIETLERILASAPATLFGSKTLSRSSTLVFLDI